MVECLTRDRGVVGSTLTGATALCPLARHIYPYLVLVQPKKIRPDIAESVLTWTKRIKSNKQKTPNKHALEQLCLSTMAYSVLRGGVVRCQRN